MALTNAPLLGTRRDAELFIDRQPELAELARNVAMGWNTLVLGEPGIGKTTLLNRVAADLEDSPPSSAQVLPIQLKGRPDSAQELLQLLFGRVVEHLESLGVQPHVLEVAMGAVAKLRAAGLGPVGPSQPGDTTAALLQTLEYTRTTVGELRDHGWTPVILVDELDSPEVTHAVFGRLRDQLWELGAVWIVAGRSADAGTLRRPPADAFFERTLTLSPFSAEAVVRFVNTRLRSADLPELSADKLDRIVQLAGGRPLAALGLLRALAAGSSLDELERAWRGYASALESLSPSARRLGELIRRSPTPARATDGVLQEELGWSASRLRQLFGELYAAGLLAEVSTTPDRPGRPSRAYVPAIDGQPL